MKVSVCSGLLAAMILAWAPAWAADTTECFSVGVTDYEMYLSAHGLGRAASERALDGEFVLGAGLTPRLSAWFGTVFSADGNLLNASTEHALGLYGTVLESPHWDLDLFLTGAAANDDSFVGGPGVEINWDAEPDLAGWGLYSRADLDFHSHEVNGSPETTADLTITLGGYWTFRPGWQLLTEYDTATMDDTLHLHGTDKFWSQGGFALGCNGALGDRIELITQFYVDVPDTGEETAIGMTVGFIATFE